MNGDDWGLCCACRKAPGTAITMLPYRAPVRGTGWGCLVCKIPNDGAIAVVCETCGDGEKPILDVVNGYIGKQQRCLAIDYRTPFQHIARFHGTDRPAKVIQ